MQDMSWGLYGAVGARQIASHDHAGNHDLAASLPVVLEPHVCIMVCAICKTSQ